MPVQGEDLKGRVDSSLIAPPRRLWFEICLLKQAMDLGEVRCRANSARIRQSGPDSGVDLSRFF